MTNLPLSAEQIAEHNVAQIVALDDDYDSLGRQLARRGIDINAIKSKVADFGVAVPSWARAVAGRALPSFLSRASRPISMRNWRIARLSTNCRA